MHHPIAMRTLKLFGLGLLAAALVAAAPVSEKSLVAPVSTALPAVDQGGTFTGRYENGIPIHRLPPIAITANRKTELARIEQEERLAASWRADRAKPAQDAVN